MLDLYELLGDPVRAEAWKKSCGIPALTSGTGESPDGILKGRAILMCAGEFVPMEIDCDREKGDVLIAVDNGLSYLENLGMLPDLLTGDFDSLSPDAERLLSDFERITPERVLHLPVMKDDTDTMAAVRLCVMLGFRKIVLYGACGGRMDHMCANIASGLWAKKHGADCFFMNADYMMFLIGPGDTKTFHPEASGMFSVFPLGERCKGVDICGMHYNLENGTLTNDFPLGEGNEIGPQFLRGSAKAINVRAAGEDRFLHNGAAAGTEAYTFGTAAEDPVSAETAEEKKAKDAAAASISIREGFALGIFTYEVEKKTREY